MSETTTTPKRIQRKRTRGWRKPHNCRCVTRPGPFGNPFAVGQHPAVGPTLVIVENGERRMPRTSEEAVESYRRWLTGTDAGRAIAERARRELRGLDLACYCPPDKPCHADVLLELANAET